MNRASQRKRSPSEGDQSKNRPESSEKPAGKVDRSGLVAEVVRLGREIVNSDKDQDFESIARFYAPFSEAAGRAGEGLPDGDALRVELASVWEAGLDLKIEAPVPGAWGLEGPVLIRRQPGEPSHWARILANRLERLERLEQRVGRVTSLHEDDILILKALAAAPIRAWGQHDIAEATGTMGIGKRLGRGKIGSRLAVLRARGLVERAHGEHGGDSITASGLAMLPEAGAQVEQK